MLIIVLLTVAVPIIALWLYIAQPLFRTLRLEHGEVTINPLRLESHVRMLSETLVPRNFGKPANLDRVADYIRAEFAAAGARVSDQPFVVDGRHIGTSSLS